MPYWIVFDVEGTIELGGADHRIVMKGDKTIDGRGRDITVNGKLRIQDVTNVIISDIHVTNTLSGSCGQTGDVLLIRGDGDDDPNAFSARDIWLHHVEAYEGGDGLVDIRGGSRVTASWSHFHAHAKGMLMWQNADKPAPPGMRVTLHHNFFDRMSRRGPQFSYGWPTFYNNYQFEWYEYGAGGIDGAQLLSENNIYEARPGTVLHRSVPGPQPLRRQRLRRQQGGAGAHVGQRRQRLGAEHRRPQAQRRGAGDPPARRGLRPEGRIRPCRRTSRRRAEAEDRRGFGAAGRLLSVVAGRRRCCRIRGRRPRRRDLRWIVGAAIRATLRRCDRRCSSSPWSWAAARRRRPPRRPVPVRQDPDADQLRPRPRGHDDDPARRGSRGSRAPPDDVLASIVAHWQGWTAAGGRSDADVLRTTQAFVELWNTHLEVKPLTDATAPADLASILRRNTRVPRLLGGPPEAPVPTYHPPRYEIHEDGGERVVVASFFVKGHISQRGQHWSYIVSAFRVKDGARHPIPPGSPLPRPGGFSEGD
jgi:hypothetical protein